MWWLVLVDALLGAFAGVLFGGTEREMGHVLVGAMVGAMVRPLMLGRMFTRAIKQRLRYISYRRPNKKARYFWAALLGALLVVLLGKRVRETETEMGRVLVEALVGALVVLLLGASVQRLTPVVKRRCRYLVNRYLVHGRLNKGLRYLVNATALLHGLDASWMPAVKRRVKYLVTGRLTKEVSYLVDVLFGTFIGALLGLMLWERDIERESEVLRDMKTVLLGACVVVSVPAAKNFLWSMAYGESRYLPPARRLLIRMEDDIAKVKPLLLLHNRSSSSGVYVIQICGVGGTGKTVLARTLFRDPSVVKYFHRRAWVRLGKDFQARDIVASILVRLSSSRSIKEKIEKMDTMQLIDELHQAQKGRRCLVVLDDLWSADAWKAISHAFPSHCTTTLLITTPCLDQVAGEYKYQMNMLSEDMSWNLFQKKTGLMEFPDSVDEIGRRILSECGGHPLSITLVSSVLRRNRGGEGWDEVLSELENYKREYDTSGQLPALALLYNHLSQKLQRCFLYLGYFPRDKKIPVEKLFSLWMAEEGLISTNNQVNETRTGIAEGYLIDLYNESLVTLQMDDDLRPRRFRSCYIHGQIHDFCLLKGKDERLFGFAGFAQGGSTCRSTAINMDTRNGPSLRIAKPKSINSLLFIERDHGPQPKSTWPKGAADLKRFKGVSALDFDGVDFKVRKLPKGIKKLRKLRHLGFRGCCIEELPQFFSRFDLLQTLDLCVKSSCKMAIPNILSNFKHLRHLYFPLVYQSAPTNDKLKLNGVTELEILENFNAGVCDAADLSQLEKLQIFKGTADGNDDDLENMRELICETGHNLRHVSLTVSKYDCHSTRRLIVVSQLLRCDGLHVLNIEGRLSCLPDSLGSGFTEIVFDGSEFSEDPMPILGRLPNLRNLVLCNDAFVGTRMECTELDFRKLEFLKLTNLSTLEHWEVEYGAMPRLFSLTVEKCNQLIEFPDNLVKILTLEEIKIVSLTTEIQQQVRRMAEEQRSKGNEYLSVTFYD